jgi:hypothetical protein
VERLASEPKTRWRHLFTAAERANERKDLFLDVPQGLIAGKLGPVRPAQFRVGEDRLVFLAAHLGGALGVLFALVESLEEQQEGKLFDGIERIGQPSGPELVLKGIDLRTQGGIGEHAFVFTPKALENKAQGLHLKAKGRAARRGIRVFTPKGLHLKAQGRERSERTLGSQAPKNGPGSAKPSRPMNWSNPSQGRERSERTLGNGVIQTGSLSQGALAALPTLGSGM